MKIKVQDKLAIFSALLVGIIAGSYLYIVGYAPVYEGSGGPAIEAADDFRLIGEAYGGRRTGVAPSFQINRAGEYRYIPAGESAVARAVETGVLPRVLWREVTATLSGAILRDAATVVTPTTCASYADGTDYRYEIMFEGMTYELDTCDTNVRNHPALAAALDSIWPVLAAASQRGSLTE